MDPFMISYIVLWLLVVFQMVLLFALVHKLDSQAKVQMESVASGLSLDNRVPDFTAQSLSGKKITLADQLGKTMVYVVVSPECKPCRQILPSINSLGNTPISSDHQMMIMSLGDAQGTERLVDELGLKLPVAIAPREENSFMSDFKLKGTPVFLLIDSQGNLRKSGYPSDESPDWKKATAAWRN